jgi:hypothetical protein
MKIRGCGHPICRGNPQYLWALCSVIIRRKVIVERARAPTATPIFLRGSKFQPRRRPTPREFYLRKEDSRATSEGSNTTDLGRLVAVFAISVDIIRAARSPISAEC